MTKELIAKLEALEEPDKGIFWEVYDHLFPKPKDWPEEHEFDWNRSYRLNNLIQNNGWESAAIMLVPEGWEWLRKSPETMSLYLPPTDNKTWAQHIDAAANHPAIALLICVLKAKEPVK